MIFNQTVIYALRAMHQLARDYESGNINSSDLAKQTSVPSHYLVKIMRQLASEGLVLTQKGHHGGYQLASRPEEVRVAEILAAMNVPLYERTCAFGWATCDPQNPCPLHWAWVDITEKTRKWAEETTLAQMSPPPLEPG